jgi:hypothetical protein
VPSIKKELIFTTLDGPMLLYIHMHGNLAMQSGERLEKEAQNKIKSETTNGGK